MKLATAARTAKRTKKEEAPSGARPSGIHAKNEAEKKRKAQPAAERATKVPPSTSRAKESKAPKAKGAKDAKIVALRRPTKADKPAAKAKAPATAERAPRIPQYTTRPAPKPSTRSTVPAPPSAAPRRAPMTDTVPVPVPEIAATAPSAPPVSAGTSSGASADSPHGSPTGAPASGVAAKTNTVPVPMTMANNPFMRPLAPPGAARAPAPKPAIPPPPPPTRAPSQPPPAHRPSSPLRAFANAARRPGSPDEEVAIPPPPRLPSPTFQVGDKAVHPAHGLGEVTAVEKRDIGGSVTTFYVLRILDNGMKVMVPTGATAQVGLREVMSAKEAEGILETMRAREVAVDVQPWSRRFRIYTEMIKSKSPQEVAKVLRDMHRLKFDKDLSFGERRLLDQAKSLLMKELALAKRITETQLEAEVQALFGA